MLAGGRPRFRTDVHHVLGYDVVHVEETAVKVWEPKFLAKSSHDATPGFLPMYRERQSA